MATITNLHQIDKARDGVHVWAVCRCGWAGPKHPKGIDGMRALFADIKNLHSNGA